MNTRWSSLFVGLLLLQSFSANAASISGNQFLDLTEQEKGWYFLGVLDSMKETRDKFFATSELDRVDFDRIWEACISDRPVRQHLAIVEEWLVLNPNRWQEPAIKLIFDAERESCNKSNEEERKKKRALACPKRMVSRAQCQREWDIANPEY